MRFTLHQLRVFSAAAELLNYTKAAEKLHLTQPAVSMQIRQLEDNVDLPLFEQTGRQLYLTDAGRELYGYAQRILEVIAEAGEVIEGMKGAHRGHLRVCVASTANYFAARLLADFSKRYPGVSISLDVTNRGRLLRQLADNETDIVIMGEPPTDADLVSEAFLENPLVAIAAPDHPLAQRHAITLEALAEHRFVQRESASGTRAAIERFFKKQGLSVKPGLEMRSNEAIKQAIEAGLGVGIVSEHTIKLELETGRLVILDVQGLPIIRHWYMVQRRGKRDTPVMRSFRDHVLEQAKRQVRQVSGQ
ncbi:MAG: LysR family transcriptional regulator [Halothiobacillaceae bacterium]|nr:LysR family transcriptional regulator [Halothiobacillaceae bacterium]